MIKLKTLLNEKYLGLGFGAGKIKEQQLAGEYQSLEDIEKAIQDIKQKIQAQSLAAFGATQGSGTTSGFGTPSNQFDPRQENALLKKYEQDLENLEQQKAKLSTGNRKEIKLDQLQFDELTKMFPKHYNQVHFTRMQPDGKEGPYYRDALAFPTPSDASSVIGDMEALEDWKDETKRRFGNVSIILDPDAKNSWDMIKIEDDKFSQDKQQAMSAKMDMLKQFGTTE
tara:strand:+ start:191 stop:868 length:678 start_codon:yes stop_codon:yes gene_type:complete